MEMRELMHKASLQLQDKVDSLHEYDITFASLSSLCADYNYKVVTEYVSAGR